MTVTDLTDDLAIVGFAVGDEVRWRPTSGGRWLMGTVIARERDGSIGIRDPQGRSRALPLDRLQRKARSVRGAYIWEPAMKRALAGQQLELFA